MCKSTRLQTFWRLFNWDSRSLLAVKYVIIGITKWGRPGWNGSDAYNEIYSIYGKEYGIKYTAILNKLEEAGESLQEALELRKELVEKLKEINKRHKK